ncbi:hypothetical protein PRIPAC_96887, partial [Pristionchus pacificus]
GEEIGIHYRSAMNILLLIFLALPLIVFGRQHRSHEKSESRETVLVGDDAFSGQPQPVEPPRRHGRPEHSDYQRPPYNSYGCLLPTGIAIGNCTSNTSSVAASILLLTTLISSTSMLNREMVRKITIFYGVKITNHLLVQVRKYAGKAIVGEHGNMICCLKNNCDSISQHKCL